MIASNKIEFRRITTKELNASSSSVNIYGDDGYYATITTQCILIGQYSVGTIV